MTKRLLLADWIDVLYNAVRSAPCSVSDAAVWLAQKRGVQISTEGLRARLNRTDGKTPTGVQLELLTEYMQERDSPAALDWVKALAARFGLVVVDVPPPPPEGWACEAEAIREKLLKLSVKGGRLTELGMRAIENRRISVAEADELDAQCMAEIQMLLRLRRNVRRAAGLEEVD